MLLSAAEHHRKIFPACLPKINNVVECKHLACLNVCRSVKTFHSKIHLTSIYKCTLMQRIYQGHSRYRNWEALKGVSCNLDHLFPQTGSQSDPGLNLMLGVEFPFQTLDALNMWGGWTFLLQKEPKLKTQITLCKFNGQHQNHHHGGLNMHPHRNEPGRNIKIYSSSYLSQFQNLYPK